MSVRTQMAVESGRGRELSSALFYWTCDASSVGGGIFHGRQERGIVLVHCHRWGPAAVHG
jgi:hypothetical protein